MRGLRSTHTYAVMEVSKATYDEIAGKLKDAGYDHAFDETRDHGCCLDMHGIALATVPEVPAVANPTPGKVVLVTPGKDGITGTG